MGSRMIGGDNGSGATERPLKLLFFLRSIHYDRVLENFLRAVLERGHELHVALVQEKRGLGDEKTRVFDDLAANYSFTFDRLPERRDKWLVPAQGLRHGLDYLRYLEPEFANAGPLRERARSRAPRLVRWLAAIPPFRGAHGRRWLRAMLRGFEAAIPVPKEIHETIRGFGPDAVLVSPLVGLGSAESDYVRAATEAGIPTVLVVASWDNLTNKGVIRDAPTVTIVWNEIQVDEAVRLHEIPREQVVPVGAHSFDHWFGWQPSRDREAFARSFHLDADRPVVLYLGSSHFIAGDETPFVREWLGRVRAHPRLAEAAVILRPHPQNVVGWDELDVDEPGKTIVWPRAGEAPTTERQKIDYFDTLFHANAMVGINTTALIEASILRRPVLTLVNDSFQTQEGTLHFSYIASGNGDGDSLVVVGRSWDEHLEQLADAIEHPQAHQERIERFLNGFVRPRGLETPAAPAAAEAVEQAAATKLEPQKSSRVLRPVLIGLTPVVSVAVPLFRPVQTSRAAVKSLQRRRKQLDRARSAKRKEAMTPEERQRLKQERAREKEGVKAKTKDGSKKRKIEKRGPKAGFIEKDGTKQAKKRKKGSFVSRMSKRSRHYAAVMRRRRKRARRAVRTVYNTRYRRTYSSTIHRLPSRDEIPALLNARKLLGRGAEIGVKTGKYSEHLLSRWKGKELISIDPWLSDDPEAYVDRSNVSQDEFERFYNETKEKLSAYGSRSTIWRLTSVEAAERVEDHSFDFVYIDARHDYESVLEDLNAWYSKVKPGGIFAGHDYVDGMLPQGDFGVKSAVDEFFAERNIPVHGTEGPSAVEQFPSWVVVIPEHEERPAAERGRKVAQPG